MTTSLILGPPRRLVVRILMPTFPEVLLKLPIVTRVVMIEFMFDRLEQTFDRLPRMLTPTPTLLVKSGSV